MGGFSGLIAAGAQGAAQGLPGASFTKPYNGSGMDLDNARRILNPAGIGGGGGLDANAVEAFLDPAGIDSSTVGLGLFGKKPVPGAGGVNGTGATLPAPNGPTDPRFYDPNSFGPRQPSAPGPFNAMAAQLAGPQYQPRVVSSFGGFNAPPPAMPTGAGVRPGQSLGAIDPALLPYLRARMGQGLLAGAAR